MPLDLIDFSPHEEGMIYEALAALAEAGYDPGLFQELIRADMPPGYRGMSLDGGAALGAEAFASQAWLDHVLEEEYLHLLQKRRGEAEIFGPGTALELELDVHDTRRFPSPPG